MKSKNYEYQKKLSYTNFITPAIGAFAIYIAITDKTGFSYRGTEIPYPASSYFFGLIGLLLLLPLIYTYFKTKRKNIIELRANDFSYTKGTFLNKKITINYKDIKSISYEDDEDDGSSIIIEIGKIFNPQFYAKKFKTLSDYSSFCEEITSILQDKTNANTV